MAIVLNNITSGYNLAKINANFQNIEDYINDKLLARADTGVAGEAMMERALDMNGNKILNVFVDVNDPDSLLTLSVADNRYYNVSGDTLTGPMDANSQIISNLPSPVQPSQPATKAYADAIQSDVDNNESRSLRFPDVVDTMADVPSRANSLQGYNNVGKPVPIFSYTDTADLALQLASTTGTSYIGLPVGTLQDNITTVALDQYVNSGAYASVNAALEACASYAASANKTIIANGPYTLSSSSINISGVKIKGGVFNGVGNTAIYVTSSSLEDCVFNGAYIRHIGGDIDINKCTFSNITATQCILSSSLTSAGYFKVRNSYFSGSNYGILRQGATGLNWNGCSIESNNFYNMKGDAIELNLVQQDQAGWGFIKNNRIDLIVGGAANSFWGIGIGIAGAGNYALETADADMAANFLIEGNVITRCRQPIHLEKARNFHVVNNVVYPDSTYAVGTGLAASGCIFFGCRDFTVSGLKSYPTTGTEEALGIRWGSVAGVYSAPCRNYVIENSELFGQTILYTGATDTVTSYVSAKNLEIKGPFTYKGYVSDLKLDGLRIVSDSSSIIQILHSTGEGAGILTRNRLIKAEFNDIQAQTTLGAPNGRASNIFVEDLRVSNCNFDITKNNSTAGNRGTLFQVIQRNIVAPGTSLPYGMELSKGDYVMKASGGGGWYITSGGAITPALDSIRATVAGQTYIESNNLNWTATAAAKTAGLRIKIPGAGPGGADLTTTVVRSAYSSGGFYRVDIDPNNPIATATASGTVIISAVEAVYVELT